MGQGAADPGRNRSSRVQPPGSAASGRAGPGIGHAALTSALLLTAVLLALAGVSDRTLAWPIAGRVLVSVVAAASAGFPLGAVFPQVIRRAGAQQPALVAWVWAVNAAASVLGAIIAAGLAMAVGFTIVAAYAVACYLVVWWISLDGRGTSTDRRPLERGMADQPAILLR